MASSRRVERPSLYPPTSQNSGPFSRAHLIRSPVLPSPLNLPRKGRRQHLAQVPLHSPASSLCGNLCTLLPQPPSSSAFTATFSYCSAFPTASALSSSTAARHLPTVEDEGLVRLLSFLSASPSMASRILWLQPSPPSRGLPGPAPVLLSLHGLSIQPGIAG